MGNNPTPKLDQLRAMREANYARMTQQTRAQTAVSREDKKRELKEQVHAIEGDGPKQKPVKRKLSRKKRT